MNQNQDSKNEKTWKTSNHKIAYLWVAMTHFTTPGNVFAIAHSHFLETPREGRICRHLVRLGVLKEAE